MSSDALRRVTLGRVTDVEIRNQARAEKTGPEIELTRSVGMHNHPPAGETLLKPAKTRPLIYHEVTGIEIRLRQTFDVLKYSRP
jgi:hypothetical protein